MFFMAIPTEIFTPLIQLFQILHLVGLTWGVGVATFGLLLNVISKRNPDLAPHVSKIMPYVAPFIFIALIILGVTGIIRQVLFAINSVNYYVTNPLIIVKQIVVGLLVANGIFLAAKLAPKLQNLAPKGGPPSVEFVQARKMAMISSYLNVIMWYAIVVLSVIM